MAYYSHSSLAYDLTLFEDAGGASEEETVIDVQAEQESSSKENRTKTDGKRPARKKRTKNGARRNRFFRVSLIVVFGLAFAFIVVSIIHGQVQLTELNQEIVNAKAQLAEQQSVYTQLEMKVDSSISTPVVEEYAQDKLGMSKATNAQKEFINLSTGDKAEVTMTSDKSIFESIAEAFASLWS